MAGSGGAGGANLTGGVAGTSGIAGSANHGGSEGGKGGDAGTAGDSGAAGSGGVPDCSITAQASLGRIPTVGVVTFSVSGLTEMTSARIDFGPASAGMTMTAPVDLAQADYRTLLLGMKGSTTYRYRISASGSSGTCTSSDYTITTGSVLPEIVNPLVVNITNPEAHDRGFIITTVDFYTVILDADGDPVWWGWVGSGGAMRAHMNWDGSEMIILINDILSPAGLLRAYTMDGTPLEGIYDTKGTHHDFTAIPGGIAMLIAASGGGSVTERAAGGTMTVVAELASLYNVEYDQFHANAIHYYPWDDSYTISDRNCGCFVKITRDGTLVWQLGGDDPKDPAKLFSTDVTWRVNHGHHLLSDGTFAFFDNGLRDDGLPPMLRVLTLDPMSMRASSVFAHEVASTPIFGDVQRTTSGNYLVTDLQRISEITPSGEVVMTIEGAGTQYTEYRPSLYGPPSY
jgi:hypothetical protein